MRRTFTEANADVRAAPKDYTAATAAVFVILHGNKQMHHPANMPLSINENSSPNMYVEKRILAYFLDVTC